MSQNGAILVFLRIQPFEATCILDINVASLVLLLFKQCRSIVLDREASNPHQSIIWIFSGLRTIFRIFARILAQGFTFAVQWYEFLQHKGQ